LQELRNESIIPGGETNQIMKISFIGFGEVGYGLTKGLKQAGMEELYFIDRLWDTPPYGDLIMKRATETGAIMKKTIEELVRASEMVISCVTSSEAIGVAKSSAPYLSGTHLYVDVNSASPMLKKEVAEILDKSGARFVDAAMMGGIPVYLHRVPILASGNGALQFKESMQPFEMNITCIGDEPGQASAIKMFRSIFMKGFVAILLETLQATHKYDVDNIVLESLAETMEKTPFLDNVRMLVTRSVVHAERRAHELEEVIRTLEEMNVPSTMSQATKAKLEWCKDLGLKEYFAGETPETLNDVFDAIDEKLK